MTQKTMWMNFRCALSCTTSQVPQEHMITFNDISTKAKVSELWRSVKVKGLEQKGLIESSRTTEKMEVTEWLVS